MYYIHYITGNRLALIDESTDTLRQIIHDQLDTAWEADTAPESEWVLTSQTGAAAAATVIKTSPTSGNVHVYIFETKLHGDYHYQVTYTLGRDGMYTETEIIPANRPSAELIANTRPTKLTWPDAPLDPDTLIR